MISLSNIFTIIEIMGAELLFLHSFPRRKRFPLRLTLLCLLAIALAAFLPDGNRNSELVADKLYLFLRYMMLFALSVSAMGLSFQTSLSALLAACSAGYAVQHIASRVTVLAIRNLPVMDLLQWVPSAVRYYAAELFFFLPVYVLAYLIFARPVQKYKLFSHRNTIVNILSIVMVMLCIGISRFSQANAVIIYPIAMCLFALLVQISVNRTLSLREENAVISRVMKENSKQYEISRESREVLNIKYHDFKYRLAALKDQIHQKEIELLSEAINVYDRDRQTGSEALDVILSERYLRCDALGVDLSVMGDFSCLNFVDTVDIYSFFGNALDNAMEAVSRIDDTEKRQISVTVEQYGDPCVVNVTNYFDGEMRLSESHTILTSKTGEEGYHGFGIRSMRMITQKYGGDLTVSFDRELFRLTAYFVKEEK